MTPEGDFLAVQSLQQKCLGMDSRQWTSEARSNGETFDPSLCLQICTPDPRRVMRGLLTDSPCPQWSLQMEDLFSFERSPISQDRYPPPPNHPSPMAFATVVSAINLRFLHLQPLFCSHAHCSLFSVMCNYSSLFLFFWYRSLSVNWQVKSESSFLGTAGKYTSYWYSPDTAGDFDPILAVHITSNNSGS